MNFAEWSTILFLPLAVMSDFSQLSSASGNTSSTTVKYDDGLIVFASQEIAEKCSYCPPLQDADKEYWADAQNPILVDCDVSYTSADKYCQFEGVSKETGEATRWNVPSENPKSYCNIRGEK